MNPLLIALHKQFIRRVASGEKAEETLCRMAASLLRDYPELANEILKGNCNES